MNPRNQMTSPLPDKETLLPPSPRKKRAEEAAKTRHMALKDLLKWISVCLEEKRIQEAAKEKEEGPSDIGVPRAPLVVPLAGVIRETLHREHGSADICAQALAQLRASCSDEVHGSHPRVSVFRRMAGWTPAERPWVAEQESACMHMCSWIGIATLQPPDKEAVLQLRMKDVNKVLDQLHRKRLLPPRARPFLHELATELVLPRSETRNSTVQLVDADQLLRCWMDRWGGWDEQLFGDGLPDGCAP